MQADFLPALDKDQVYMFTPSELPLYRHAQDHRLITLDILGYPSLFGDILDQPLNGTDIKSYPDFRCTVEVQQGVTRPAAAARQPGAEMNETYGMSTSEGISQDN